MLNRVLARFGAVARDTLRLGFRSRGALRHVSVRGRGAGSNDKRAFIRVKNLWVSLGESSGRV